MSLVFSNLTRQPTVPDDHKVESSLFARQGSYYLNVPGQAPKQQDGPAGTHTPASRTVSFKSGGTTVVNIPSQDDSDTAIDSDAETRSADKVVDIEIGRLPSQPSVEVPLGAKQKMLHCCFQCIVDGKRMYYKLGVNHAAPIALLFLYALAGAGIFYSFEHTNELILFKTKQMELEEHRVILLRNISRIYRSNLPENRRFEVAKRFLMRFEKQHNVGWEYEKPQWTYLGAVFYSGTVFTTIGYGNIAPLTVGGRAFTIVFAIFGIPLVLAILNDLGKLLCKWINIGWKRFIEICEGQKKLGRIENFFKFRSKKQEADAGKTSNDSTATMQSSRTGKLGRGILERQDEVSEGTLPPSQDDYDDDAEKHLDDIPVLLALAITITWIFFCAAVFLTWERKWDYWTSFYFFFVSLTTIGLGDIVPERQDLMIWMFGLVIMGLSLVSMCVNVIGQKIENFLYKMMKMIREEYNKIMEDGEQEITDDARDVIMQRIWDKQPWYYKATMPLLMGERQKKQLEEHADAVANEVMTERFYQLQLDAAMDDISAQSPLSTPSLRRRTIIAAAPPRTSIDLGVQAGSSDFLAMYEALDAEVQTDTYVLLGIQDVCIQACFVDNEITRMQSISITELMNEAVQTEPTNVVTLSCQTDGVPGARPSFVNQECQWDDQTSEIASPKARRRSFNLQVGDGDVNANLTTVPVRKISRVLSSVDPTQSLSLESLQQAANKLLQVDQHPEVRRKISVRCAETITSKSLEDITETGDDNAAGGSRRPSMAQAETSSSFENPSTAPDVIPQQVVIQVEEEEVECMNRCVQTDESRLNDDETGQTAKGRWPPVLTGVQGCQTDSPRALGILRDCPTSVSLDTAERYSQTESLQVRDSSTLTNKVLFASKAPRRQNSIEYFDVDSQTDSSRFVADLIVQTDDSYLRIAKKLNQLQVNRAKSLYIMAAPNTRLKRVPQAQRK